MTTRSKTIHRLLSLVLCLCMVLTLLPMIPMEAEAAAAKTLYLKPNSNWTQANARFAAYFFNNSTGKNTWAGMTDSDKDGIYEVTVPDGDWPNVIFCRMNPNTTANNWNNGTMWNQTADLTVPTNSNNCYVVKSGTWNKGGGSWCQLCYHTFSGNTCSKCNTTGVTIYFQNNWKWSKVSLYYWFGPENALYNMPHPGVEMTYYDNDGSNDYYVMTIPQNVTAIQFNGIKDDGSSTRDKIDITSGWKNNLCYYMEWDNGNIAKTFDISTVKFPCKHNNVVDVAGSAATCTATGLTAGTKCADCGEPIQAQDVIPALGHTWSNATCDAPKTCSVCGATEGDAAGHSYSAEITTAPGCETTGVKTYTCGDCGDVYTEPLAATGHSYKSEVTAPDCINGGYTTYTCGACGHSNVADETDALGHDYKSEITTAPGCESEGVETFTCANCGDSYTKPVSATGHSYQADVTEPDCEKGGYTTYTCSACGDSYVSEYTEALGHKHEATEYVWAEDYSTCTASRTCGICGEAEYETLEALVSEEVPATCQEPAVLGYSALFIGVSWAEAQMVTMVDPTGALNPDNHVSDTMIYLDNGNGTHNEQWSCCGADAGIEVSHADADESGRCDDCYGLMAPAQLRKVSVSLKGNIAVNYYMLLSEEVLADDTAYMYFKLVDGELTIPVGEGIPMELDGETYYVYTCAVDAKEMTDNIVSQFFYGNNVTREHTYNVQTYGKHILAAYDDQATRDLITAMLNYGAASQLHFGYNTDKLANDVRDDKGNALIAAPDYSDVTIAGFNAVAGQGTDLAKFYSASLILKSETTVRFFFQVDSAASFTASYNGQELTVGKRSGLYYVDVVGISAKDLDEDVTIAINDGTNSTEVSFNPMSYCQGVLNDTTGAFSNEMKDLVRALYLYNQAANVYFKEV